MSDTLAVPGSKIIGLDGRPINTSKWFDEENEDKAEIFRLLGNLDDIDIKYNDVLVAKYIRQEVAQGIIASAETQREDRYQGKVGLVLKLGRRAFVDDDHTKFYGVTVQVGEWVAYRNTDGWDGDIFCLGSRTSKVECRFVQDAHIRCVLRYPGRLY